MGAVNDQLKEFQRVNKVLLSHGLVHVTNFPVAKPLGGGRVRLASTARGDEHAPHLASGSLRERVLLDEAGAFTLKMVDGALIQLMWEFDRAERLVKHRYAFLPSPISAPSDPNQEVMGLAERMGSLLEEVADELRLGGAFRIDFDAAAATDVHPATHLTLFGAGLEEGRTPIKGPWCLTRFIHFVFCLVAPPTVVKDGKRQIDQEIQRAIAQLNVAMGRRDLPAPHDERAWIGWGRQG
jgi:hypothetical protein